MRREAGGVLLRGGVALAVAGVAALALAASAAAATNLIANGTFEGSGAGSLIGWGASNGTLAIVAGSGGGHATRVQSGDTWLSQLLPAIFASSDYQAGRTLVLVTWDEGNETAKAGIDCTTQADIDAAGCHVGMIAASAYITPGTRDATRYTPYSTLAAIETMDGLPLLGRAQTATPLGPGMGF